MRNRRRPQLGVTHASAAPAFEHPWLARFCPLHSTHAGVEGQWVLPDTRGWVDTGWAN